MTMFETSETTAKLDSAMAKAQGKIEGASKDKVNPAFKSRYADLTSVWGAIRAALSEQSISVTQWPVNSDDGKMHLITRLAHDGEWIKSQFSIPVTKADAHGHGSALSYMRRYALSAAVGVVADDDDDGNAASRKPEPPVERDVFGLAQGTNGASKAGSRDEYAKLIAGLRASPTIKALADWQKNNHDAIDKLPPDWVDELRTEYVDRKNELTKLLAA